MMVLSPYQHKAKLKKNIAGIEGLYAYFIFVYVVHVHQVVKINLVVFYLPI